MEERERTEEGEQQIISTNGVIQGACVVQERSNGQFDRGEVAPSMGGEHTIALVESCLIMTKSQSDYVEKGQLDQTMGEGGNKTDNCGNSGEMGGVRTNIESMGGDMRHGDEPQCEFRRGVCLTHKLKGNKKTLSIKKWKKKKYGYGWVTVKETQYSCSYRAGNTTEYQDIMNSEGNCKSPARNIGDISGCSGSVLGINREGLFSDCDASLERESVKNED